jgi:thiol-disulfide isomerase/thioredoxin
MTAIAVFVLFAAFQNVTFQVTGDWSAAVIRARQSAAESASRPFGPDAESVLAVALSAAKQQDKRVLLHIGSPPCSACRALDEFLERNQGLFQDDFIIVNIDPSRMRRGDAVENRLRHGQRDGTPWMVILDADGHALISSDGPKGNIGFPSEPEEIAYFVGMIQKTKKRTSDEKIAAITQAFQEHRAQRGKK